MYVVLIILTLIAAILLIGVVLIQKSKGGGLSSSFAGSNQIMGVRRTNSFIEKVTWILAGAICLFAVVSTFFMPNALGADGSRVKSTTPVQQQTGGNYDSPVSLEDVPAETAPAAEAAPAE
ncbi:preprotein translocase subunit SecG [Muribaculaceae bacterium Isolate-104 (HZI)]|mgnify:CR=1 FL=1|jgi:preprotein translocase subunit SecG|nr:preprotein translocase subunit SecG [Muribaculaceae bacterium Isolate-104 (HZI)]